MDLSALATTVPGAVLRDMGPARLQLAFPPVDYAYDPSAPAAPPGRGGVVADWVMKHVVRPVFTWGPVRYAPGDGQADYSALATVGAIGIGALGLGLGGWILWRAFGR